MLTLQPLTAADCEMARYWRNAEDVRGTLRTPYLLTAEQQAKFFADVVCDRAADSRWWAVRMDTHYTVGMTGLTDVSWENGHAEISLIIDPTKRGHGFGRQAVGLVMREAFDRMRLDSVYGEVYVNNPAMSFWARIVAEYNAYTTTLPKRKWWGGKHWDSLWFSIASKDWRERQ